MPRELTCLPDDFKECAAKFCCLGDDALEMIIGYLLVKAAYGGDEELTPKQILELAAQYGELPVSFTEHDYLSALACIAAMSAEDEDGGMDIFVDAQKAGWNQISPDMIRLLTIIAICSLTNHD